MAPVQPPRLLASLALCAVVLAPLAASAQNGRAAAVNGRPLVLSAEAVLLLDPDGRTLYAKNPEEDRAPASLVKLMTLYLVYEDVEAGGPPPPAERLGGDEATFVSRMNAKTHVLGLSDTRFANAHGLPDPFQRSTARDLAQLTARLPHDHPASRTLP